MSTSMRESGLVRRMVSLPRSIIGGFSRAMDHGINIMGIGGRRNQNPILNFPFQRPAVQEPHSNISEEWAFLACFEQDFGTEHPFFYACTFMEALKMAQDEKKFVFVYLHSPEHPFTASFCRETLCSELVVQFLDANFVSWGAIASRGEGLQMANTLRPASFPFCAVVAPASNGSILVMQQVEGPISPSRLIDTLQRTIEEQGLAFGSGRAKEEERRRANSRLREEQDAAYLASLQIDKEKEKLKNLSLQEGAGRREEVTKKVELEKPKTSGLKFSSKVKENKTTRGTQPMEVPTHGNDQVTQILIRFPNGERKERSFLFSDKVRSIYSYIDSLGLVEVGNYRLISSFPRKIFGVEQMGMTLKDAGLHPRASLFLELLSHA